MLFWLIKSSNISAFYFNLTVLKIKKEHLQSFDIFLPLTFKLKNTRNLVNYDILCFLETLLTFYMIIVARDHGKKTK